LKILYIHQYFKTPEEGGGIRSYHIAKAMVEAGHEVEMITACNKSSASIAFVDGIKVYYLPVSYNNTFSFLKRIWSFTKFAFRATILSLQLKNEVLYVTSTPLSVGGIALLNKWIKGKPYIFEVRDLWPAVPIQMRIITNRILKNILLQFEKVVYKNAQSIVALSPGIEAGIKAVVPTQKITLIPNFSDLTFFKPLPEEKRTTITISYIGTLGKANGLSAFVQLAAVAHLKYSDLFHFNIMGEGAEKAALVQKVYDLNLPNVSFLPFGNKEEVRKLMQKTEIMYISFAQYDILGATTSPNKFFDALAMHQVIITNFSGWLTEIILKNNAGFQHYFGHEEELLTTIQTVYSDNISWIAMKHASGKLALNQFNLKDHVKRVLLLL
jgi:glycosyltransferase involved in cell wall biosynthesis